MAAAGIAPLSSADAARVFAGRDAFVRDFIGQAAALTGEHNPLEMHTRATTIAFYSGAAAHFEQHLPLSYYEASQRAVAQRIEESARPIFIYNHIFRHCRSAGRGIRWDRARLPNAEEMVQLKWCKTFTNLLVPPVGNLEINARQLCAIVKERKEELLRQSIDSRDAYRRLELLLPLMNAAELAGYSIHQLCKLTNRCFPANMPFVFQELSMAIARKPVEEVVDILYRQGNELQPGFAKAAFTNERSWTLLRKFISKAVTPILEDFYESVAALSAAVSRAKCPAKAVILTKIACILVSIVWSFIAMIWSSLALSLFPIYWLVITIPALCAPDGLSTISSSARLCAALLIWAVMPVTHVVGLVIAIAKREFSFETLACPAMTVFRTDCYRRLVDLR